MRNELGSESLVQPDVVYYDSSFSPWEEGVVVVVKWSACLPSTPTIRVRGDAYSFSVKFAFEKNENKQKEAGVGPLKNSRKFFCVVSNQQNYYYCVRNIY